MIFDAWSKRANRPKNMGILILPANMRESSLTECKIDRNIILSRPIKKPRQLCKSKLNRRVNAFALRKGRGIANMKTVFLLMARYEGLAVIPVDVVCRDFFSHLTPEKFIRKISSGEIEIPLVRMESSQKAAKGIHLQDLATYLDGRRDMAIRELKALTT